MNDLRRIKRNQMLVFALLLLLLLLLGYNNLILKNIPIALALAVAISSLVVLALVLARKKESLLAEYGLIKRLGKQRQFNHLNILSILVGLLLILSAASAPADVLHLIFKSTIGIIWVLVGIGNRPSCYLEIRERYIVKLKVDWMELGKVDRFEHFDDTIVLRSGNKKMEIFLKKLTPSEKETLAEALKMPGKPA